ncbi:MAG: isoprenylcysteine carboxylmethyltransferase family protein [Devosiaceae bacterium]|nr:isoprenylcysteine carboxylmethyltransferase family protein [Devosiaceae bacterium MH13]
MESEALVDVRYVLAVVLVIVLPVVAAFWGTIHGGISLWKRRPLWQGYTAALVVMLVVAAVSIANLRAFVGPDLGWKPVLFGIGSLLYLASWRIAGKVRRHLNFRTFSGVAEVRGEAGELLTGGPFAVVRHPRYFMVLSMTLGWSLAANHAGGYVVSLLFAAALFALVRLEERELVARFGQRYAHYQASVPMLFPAPWAMRHLFV